MRTPNDVKLAENVNNIDLILGGHDHVFEVKNVNNKYIVKSGTDFRQFSKITLNFGKTVEVNVDEISVTKKYAQDPAMLKHLEKYSGKKKKELNYTF